MDDKIDRHGQPNPHVMDRFRRWDGATPFPVDVVGFGVDDVPFDIPQPVISPVTPALDMARVHRLAQ
jgi:hypothetical protein